MDNLTNFINHIIKKTNRQPFLFIGSGFSKRYLNLENWEELLRKFSFETSGDSFKYDFFSSQIEESSYYGKQPKIASLIEKEYNHKIFNSPDFNDFRETYSKNIRSGVSPFKISIANYFSQIDCSKIDNENEEVKELKKMSVRNVAGIITTNYDFLLETLFLDYKTYIGQEELLFSDIFEIGEIYKIHGCASNPESIIINNEDYEKFEKKSAYLIAKILTIFLEYPIIFIGYSINDRNIQNILKSISNCLTQEKLNILKERFIFIEYSKEETEISTFSKTFENTNEISMIKISTNNFIDLFKGINKTTSKFNPKILRKLKKEIYSLVETVNPKSKIIAAGLDTIDKLDEDTMIMASVGVSRKHGHLIKAKEIYEDLIFDNKFFNPNLMLNEYLPELLKNNSGGLPMYKYIEDTKNIFGKIKEHYLKRNSIDDFLNTQLKKSKTSYRTHLSLYTIEEIIEIEGKENAYKRIFFLNEDEIILEKLEDYLKTNFNNLELNTELKRLIRIYDFLKYRKRASA